MTHSFREHLGQQAIGTWVKLPALESVEIMAFAGFDFVVVDMEHAPLGLERVYQHIAIASALGVAPLVRVPDHSGSTIQRVLDCGAAGVLVPHVDSAVEAAAVAAAVRFPPHGTRGSGGTSGAARWGLLGREEYQRFGNEEALCIVQIESPNGVDDIASIVGVLGVDAVFIGAADLSLDAGIPVADPQVQAMIDRVLEVTRASGTPAGWAVGADAAAAERAFARGFDFVVAGNDLSLLAKSAQVLVTGIRSLQEA